MASAFETALAGVQSDVTAQIGEATPFMVAIAGLFVVWRLTKKLVKSVL